MNENNLSPSPPKEITKTNINQHIIIFIIEVIRKSQMIKVKKEIYNAKFLKILEEYKEHE